VTTTRPKVRRGSEQYHPKPGDILRASELIECWHGRVLATFEELITAWQRSLPGLFCPLRIEDGRILFRRNPASIGPLSEWGEAFVSKAAHVWWSLVEEEATGEANRYPEEPTIAAVVCISVDRWKPVQG
jgi:hypothetical protein